MSERNMTEQVLTKQKLIDADEDVQALEDVVNGEPGKLVKTRLGREVYTLASVPQINTMTREEVAAAVAPKANKADVDAALAAYASGRKAYTTLALAQADQANLPANTAIEVTNDGANNGTYQWDGTTLTKSDYDPLTQAKNYADLNKIDFRNINHTNTGNLAATATVVQNYGLDLNFIYQYDTAYESRIVKVLNGQPLYVFNSLQQYSEQNGFGYAFFDKDPSIDPSAVRVVDNRNGLQFDELTGLKYQFVNVPEGASYLVFNTKFTSANADWSIHTGKFSNDYSDGDDAILGINGIGLFTGLSEDAVKDINNGDVVGDVYSNSNFINMAYLGADNTLQLNGLSDWVVLAQPILGGADYFLKIDAPIEDPFKIQLSTSDQTVTSATKLATTLEPTFVENVYKLHTTPAAKGLFMQVKMGAALDITGTLSIQKGYFSMANIGKKSAGICSINGIPIVDIEARASSGISIETNSSENRYLADQLATGWYVSVADKSMQPYAGWKVAVIPVTSGETLSISAADISDPFTFGFYNSNPLVVGKQNIAYSATVDSGVITVTVPSGATHLAINAYIVGGGNNLDIQNTLIVSAPVTPTANEISKINGNTLVDTQARLEISRIGSRFKDAKVFAFGDSITEGTQGGYVKYLSEVFGTTVANYGSSGARTSRVVDIVTAGSGLAKRDVATASIVWETKDYTNLACVTLMIGTNDLADMPMGSLTDIPTSNLTDHANPLDYWALFANTYIGNIALVIEFIKSKAPKAEIHIVTPIYGYYTSLGPEATQGLIPHLKAVTRYYGVHLIYGTYESGLSYKLMNPAASNPYSYDGVHLNVLGNEVFGKFLAQKVLNFG